MIWGKYFYDIHDNNIDNTLLKLFTVHYYYPKSKKYTLIKTYLNANSVGFPNFTGYVSFHSIWRFCIH